MYIFVITRDVCVDKFAYRSLKTWTHVQCTSHNCI